MGGMGKTALASEAAEWWTRSGLFRDGACFVSFEQFTSAERVVQVFGCYVAGENFNQLPPGEQRRRAIEFIQQQQVLLVWDNFESTLPQFNDAASPYTDDERHRLAELFADLTRGPGHGAVLVTCRPGETGLPGARRHELHGLARADSLWLLAGIVQRHDQKLSDPRLSRERLAPLLDDLADHPLSIELVGPHLQTLTPEAIRADFAKPPRPLRAGRPARSRRRERAATRRCSRRSNSRAATSAPPRKTRCRGSACSAAASSRHVLLDVSQLDPEAWEPIRDELQGIALVRVEDEIQIANRPFLRFHPTLAAAAADDRLAQQPETRRRFVDVYGAVRQMLHTMLAGSQSRAALAILDREEANYRCAVRWAIGEGMFRDAAGLGATFCDYLEMSGRLRERDAWVSMLRDATQQGAFTEEAVHYERQAAWTRFRQGDPQGAVAQLQALVEQLRSTSEFDPAFQLASAVGDWGKLLLHAGASSQATPILHEAVGLWETLVEKEAGQTWEALLATGEPARASNELGSLCSGPGRSGECSEEHRPERRGAGGRGNQRSDQYRTRLPTWACRGPLPMRQHPHGCRSPRRGRCALRPRPCRRARTRRPGPRRNDAPASGRPRR
jgi:hypothetical protein